MVNYNGQWVDSETLLSNSNRSFLYGDGIFETLKIVNNKILFFEDHYFRLMASLRIVRMKIPKNFTLEFLESQILDLAKVNHLSDSARVRLTVFRNDGGFYLPTSHEVSYLIQISKLDSKAYEIKTTDYEVDLYKDFFVAKQLLSTLKTTNKMIFVTGSIFANENGFQNCIVLNNEKNVAETLHGNLFLVTNNQLITPPIAEGCLNGIMRKQILKIAKTLHNLEVLESIISPFDLQKADELFVTNIISGIQPITKYRKKEYQTQVASQLLIALNNQINV